MDSRKISAPQRLCARNTSFNPSLHSTQTSRASELDGILLRNGGSGLIAHLEKFYGEIATGNKDAAREIGYFKKRKAHMKYPEYRKEGFYIGSGIIEAACRTDVARRCKQAGMHWRLRNAAAMCALVARLRSGVPADKHAA